jgi:glycosyltransferase involved in cell wall biosynthesis
MDKKSDKKNKGIILSIITVNLNNLSGLEKTIQSVSGQSFEDFEFIVVDGASVDGSIEILKAKNNRIDHWISEPDKGIYHAMNKGIRQAKGKYCLFLNSGDWLEDKDVLSRVFGQEQDADIISGDIAFYDTVKKAIKWLVPSPDILTAKTLFNGTLPHQASFIKRELFEKYGFYNENLKIAADWQFFLETLLEHLVTYHHYQGLVAYFNMNGISCQPETQNLPLKEKRAVLESKYPRFISDYDLLDQLEKEDQIWKNSKEFRVYGFLNKTGIIGIGVFIIRTFNFIKRKFSHSQNLKT